MRVTRLGSALLPLAVFVYLVLAFPEVLRGDYDSNKILILLAALGWVALGIYLVDTKVRYRVQTIWWLSSYHILMIGFLLFVTGFGSPIVYLWSILLLSSYVYFKFEGLTLSLVLLLSTGLVDSMLGHLASITLNENLAYSLIVAIIGGVAASVIRAASSDQERLDAAREQSELQRQRITTLINNLGDAIINLDSHGKITLYNAATLSLLDTNAAIDNKYIDTIFSFINSDNEPIKLSNELKSIKAVTIRDDLHTTISDEIIRLELTISPIRSSFEDTGKHAGWILIMRDVTAAKSLEEERDEFISVVSHELRTPITVAEGTVSNVQLMMERGESHLDKLKPAVDMAHEQIIFLAKMVNDLSTLSRAERGVAGDAEDIDVDELIHNMYNEYEPQASAKGLQLNLHMPAKVGSVLTSRLYLKELLQNFVTNSIKYTKEGSVTIDVKKSREDLITFAVSDTGIGISKADQKRIFEKFYRAEDYRTRETSGTGLGLYVAVKLAKKIGTSIDMKSRLNHGSTFSIALPAAKK